MIIEKLFPKLNKQVEDLANHKKAVQAVFPIAFLEAIIFPIPPEVLIAGILSYRKDVSWKKIAFFSTLGSVCGALVMYAIGYFLYDSVGVKLVEFYGLGSVMETAKETIHKHAFLAIMLAAFTPLPDRIFTLVSGVFSINLLIFIPAVFIGRGLRAGLVAYAASKYGDHIKNYMFKRADQVLLFIAILILVVLYVTTLR